MRVIRFSVRPKAWLDKVVALLVAAAGKTALQLARGDKLNRDARDEIVHLLKSQGAK